MAIEIRAVGGYKEVGKNMTAIKIGDEVVIIDMGIHIPNYIHYTQDSDIIKLGRRGLIEAGAIPDDSLIYDWRDKVIAIIPTHAHLDHVAAIPFLASRYNCPIITTPFTAAVIKRIAEDQHIMLKNEIKVVDPNTTIKLSDNIELIMVGMSHSIPDTVTVALRTPEGIVTYSNDFKLDQKPVIGNKANIDLLKELGEEGVLVSVVNCLYAWNNAHTESESAVKGKLKKIFDENDVEGKAVVTTTFSSHIARHKTLIEQGQALGRKVVMLGRSMAKYSSAAKDVGLYDYPNVEIIGFPRQVRRKIKQIMKEGKENYFLIVTGHQGETKALLSRMSRGELPWKWDKDDYMIFSSQVIPSEINKEQFKVLYGLLERNGLHNIFEKVHVSGHASRKDLQEFIEYLRPEHVIPGHGVQMMVDAMEELCKTLGMDDKHIHLIKTGETLKLERQV